MGGGGTDREAVVITVEETNRAPVLSSIGSQRVAEGEHLEFVVSATDADGDGLTYSMEDGPAGASLSNRTFSWRPGYAQSGTYRVTFVISDGQGSAVEETVVITVGETNRAPVLASIGSQEVAEGERLRFVLSATDADGDELTYSMEDGPAGASLSNRTFSWRPGYAQSGTYRVTFVVSDGYGGTDQETVTITVEETSTGIRSWRRSGRSRWPVGEELRVRAVGDGCGRGRVDVFDGGCAGGGVAVGFDVFLEAGLRAVGHIPGYVCGVGRPGGH